MPNFTKQIDIEIIKLQEYLTLKGINPNVPSVEKRILDIKKKIIAKIKNDEILSAEEIILAFDQIKRSFDKEEIEGGIEEIVKFLKKEVIKLKIDVNSKIAKRVKWEEIEEKPEMVMPEEMDRGMEDMKKEHKKEMVNMMEEMKVKMLEDCQEMKEEMMEKMPKEKPISHKDLLEVLPDQHHKEYHKLESHIESEWRKKFERLISGNVVDDLHKHTYELPPAQTAGPYIDISGAYQPKTTAVSADYTVRETDDVLLVNATSGNIEIKLEQAIYRKSILIIKNVSTAGSNTITITPNGSEQIDNAANYTMNDLNESVILVSDSSDWWTQRGETATAFVSDTAYAASWDGVTDVAPSKNAVYDKIETLAAALSGTINEIAYFDSATTIASLAVATYPSLTELSYVKGVSSAIQTQLGGKAATDQTMYIGTTAVAINRASAALTLAGITLTTPDIGTPSAGVATNITGLVPANIVAGTLVAKINLGEGADTATIGLEMDASMSADERYSGITVPGTAGATLAFGDLCYLDVTAAEWLLADASAIATGGNVILGICVDASTDGAATSMLLLGTVRSAAFPASVALGAPVYVSETAGDITATAPVTTDSVMRIVGYAVTVEPNTIYFNPENDFISHT